VHEGLPLLLPSMTKRLLPFTRDDLWALLSDRYVMVGSLSPKARETLEKEEERGGEGGSFAAVYYPREEDRTTGEGEEWWWWW